MTPAPHNVLIRNARLVPVGEAAPANHRPLDIRIAAGIVQTIASKLTPQRGEEVLEAEGRWVIPGLWDQHVHMLQWAQTRSRLDVSRSSCPDDVARIVAQHIADLPPSKSGSWVFGYGFRSASWADQPTVADLDAVSGRRPVVLTSGDGHTGWLNSAALSALDIPATSGVLTENPWFALMPVIVARTADDSTTDAALRAAMQEAASLGVVGIVDFELAAGYLDWPERFAAGFDQLRVRPAVYPDRLDEVIGAGFRTGQPLVAGGSITMGPLKIIYDGSLNTRTACCCDPYADADRLEHPRGRLNFTPDQLVDLLTRATSSGLDVAVHAIGDAAVQSALDAFATTRARGSIEHAQLVGTRDMGRMSELGVRASVQPAHLLDDRDVTFQCWPDRADRCFPLRSLMRAGVALALGSDAPVAQLNPWLAMAAAVHRSGDDRDPWNPAEALTAAEALAASTDGRPTLAPGHRADLALLDAYPFADTDNTAASAAQLRAVPVAVTLLAGRTTHSTL